MSNQIQQMHGGAFNTYEVGSVGSWAYDRLAKIYQNLTGLFGNDLRDRGKLRDAVLAAREVEESGDLFYQAMTSEKAANADEGAIIDLLCLAARHKRALNRSLHCLQENRPSDCICLMIKQNLMYERILDDDVELLQESLRLQTRSARPPITCPRKGPRLSNCGL